MLKGADPQGNDRRDEARTMGQSILTIDLGALAENWRRLADRARGAECAAVVKADAYGLGIAPVARALLDEGCKTFFVAHLREGEILRQVVRMRRFRTPGRRRASSSSTASRRPPRRSTWPRSSFRCWVHCPKLRNGPNSAPPTARPIPPRSISTPA